MSTVRDRNVIDVTLTENDRYVLIINDDLPWSFGERQSHARTLQDKINDYLNYIVSGQAEEAHPGCRCVIRVSAEHPYSRYGMDFLEKVREFLKTHEDPCDLEWTHPEDDREWDDGFSDDFVFDPSKVFVRLKKNWSRNPLDEISLMASDENAPDYQNMPMYRYMDSFVYFFMQDVGNAFTYLTYDNLPEDTDVQELQKTAFANMAANVHYQLSESKIKGVYGFLAGGDFEAESLLFPELFQQAADMLNDDLLISVPTKDIVFVTKANDLFLPGKMLKQARDMFETNLRQTPHLLFCRDVFRYNRKDNTLTIDKRRTL